MFQNNNHLWISKKSKNENTLLYLFDFQYITQLVSKIIIFNVL